MRCEYKRFSKIKLCPPDLTKLISICERATVDTMPNQAGGEIPQVNEVQSLYAGCETVSPMRPVKLLNLDVKTTHVFYVRFADLLVQIDAINHVLRCDGVLYRIDDIEDLGEFHETVAIYCRKSGEEFAQLVTLSKYTEQYDIDTGTNILTKADYKAWGIEVKFTAEELSTGRVSNSEINGERLIAGDMLVMLERSQAIPQAGDTLTLASGEWRIIAVEANRPAGYEVIYKVQVRQ